MSLPALLSPQAVHERLQIIFPPGTPHRNYCTRKLAASTVYVALYIGAVEGSAILLGPKHVYRMTDEQAAKTGEEDRRFYATAVMKAGYEAPGRRWYKDNTREPIRDETLRDGLISLGAVVEMTNVATTSSKPRYALQVGFAKLFNPDCEGTALDDAVAAWQLKHLSRGALARIAVVRSGAALTGTEVMVTFPNGDTRRLKPGPSSEIAKAVIEKFAPNFLRSPAVLFLSESGNKIIAKDDAVARAIGLEISVDRNLPDLILVDLGPSHPLLVFVEIVATDGPINERRKTALQEVASGAGFSPTNVSFVTAYLDRAGSPFKRTADTLAWGSYAWFASEPDGLVELIKNRRRPLEPG